MPDLQDQIDQLLFEAEDHIDVYVALLCKRGIHPWIAKAVGGGLGLAEFVAVLVLSKIIAFIGPIIIKVLPSVVDLLETVRGDDSAGMNKLTTSTINAYLNTDFNPAELKPSTGTAKDAARFEQIGQKITSVIENLVAPTGEVSPEDGPRAAHRLMGYMTDIAIENGVQGILMESISGGQLETWGQMGDTLANIIGLTRLQRRGLSLLLEKTVSDPYEWHLNKKYRTKRLGVSQYVRAHRRGKLSRADLAELLAREGYRDSDIELLIELDDIASVEARMAEFVNILEARVADGLISVEDASLFLENLPFSEGEKIWQRRIFGLRGEGRKRKLTLAQMRQAAIDGLVTFGEFTDFLISEGYSTEDALILELQLQLDIIEISDKERARQKREDARRAKGTQPPA